MCPVKGVFVCVRVYVHTTCSLFIIIDKTCISEKLDQLSNRVVGYITLDICILKKTPD